MLWLYNSDAKPDPGEICADPMMPLDRPPYPSILIPENPIDATILPRMVSIEVARLSFQRKKSPNLGTMQAEVLTILIRLMTSRSLSDLGDHSEGKTV